MTKVRSLATMAVIARRRLFLHTRLRRRERSHSKRVSNGKARAERVRKPLIMKRRGIDVT
jgi:hypothetical protein